MNTKIWIAIPILLASLSCHATEKNQDPVTNKVYTVMQDDLAELKADFNEAVDQVRLVFIVGPT